MLHEKVLFCAVYVAMRVEKSYKWFPDFLQTLSQIQKPKEDRNVNIWT